MKKKMVGSVSLPNLRASPSSSGPASSSLVGGSPLNARQTTLLSEVSPFSSKRQKRRFRQIASDLVEGVPRTQFNPVVLWEDDGNGELAMKVITKREGAEKLQVNRYSMGKV